MMTYILFKMQSMLLSAMTGKATGPQMLTSDLQPVQNPNMLLSATSRACLPDAGLHPLQNPEHAVVSNK
jgi:hypothetical protein